MKEKINSGDLDEHWVRINTDMTFCSNLICPLRCRRKAAPPGQALWYARWEVEEDGICEGFLGVETASLAGASTSPGSIEHTREAEKMIPRQYEQWRPKK